MYGVINYRKVAIKKIGDVVTGKTPSTANPEYYDGNYMFISPKELHGEYSITKSEKAITQAGMDCLKNQTIKGTSVLVGCIGWDMGNVAMCFETCATNQQINSITNIKSAYNPYYIYYWLSGKKEYLFSIASVTRTPILSKGTFEHVEIPLPDKTYQDVVANVLLSIDKKIELNNRINDNLSQLNRTIYDYWFTQFDFPDKIGKPYRSSGGEMEWNTELHREIPKDWKIGNLYDIADFINGVACQKYYAKGDEPSIPIVKIKEMHDGVTNETEFVTKKIPLLKQIYTGDILFSWSATLEVMLWTGGHAGLNQHIFKVVPKPGYSREFVYQQLLMYVITFQKIAEARKTTMGHITSDHIYQSRIPIPPETLINTFTKIEDPIVQQLLAICSENNELKRLKGWVLPLLMNGQTTVKD